MSLLQIKDYAHEVHKNAVSHGWWEEERSFGELIALMHSELSEALEEYRSGHDYTEIYTACKNCANKPKAGYNCEIGERCDNWEKRDKPEGIPVELADCIIRILDACEWYGIDIEAALEIKHEYNQSRPCRHVKKGELRTVLTADIPLDRLEEICNAEREGRCVILPCKVGDTVYVIPSKTNRRLNIATKLSANNRVYEQRVESVKWFNNFNWCISTCDGVEVHRAEAFGKTVFLTYAEAEAALKGAEHDRD